MTPLEEYQLETIEDTLRLVANTLKSSKRETCLDRHIMLCWNWIYDSLHDVPHDVTVKNGVKYRMKVGQTPYNDKKKI